jgi:transposase
MRRGGCPKVSLLVSLDWARPQARMSVTAVYDLVRRLARRLDLHLVVDNYGTHKHPEVREWLAAHPRFHMHFTPTSGSWLNLVERWFSSLTTRRIRRGVFRSVRELERAIREYITLNNQDPRPFVWTKTAPQILRKIRLCKDELASGH